MIPEQDRDVLADLARVAVQEGLSPMVVGAGARLLLLDWELEINGGRATTDWDIAVRVESWSAFHNFRRALLAVEGDRFGPTSCEHRVVHSSGRSIDIIPYGGIESPPGAITWPSDNRRMLVAPLSPCSALCTKIDLGSELSILVVTVPALALLKAFAYFERRDGGEVRDLEDFDFILKSYICGTGDDRIFEEAPELLAEGLLTVEDAGAFLLGFDLARDFAEDDLRPIFRLVEEANDAYGGLVNALVRPAWDDERDQAERRALQARFAAVRQGLAAGSDS